MTPRWHRFCSTIWPWCLTLMFSGNDDEYFDHCDASYCRWPSARLVDGLKDWYVRSRWCKVILQLAWRMGQEFQATFGCWSKDTEVSCSHAWDTTQQASTVCRYTAVYLSSKPCNQYSDTMPSKIFYQFLSDTQWSMSILSIANMFTSRHPFGNAIVKVWVKAGHLKPLWLEDFGVWSVLLLDKGCTWLNQKKF